MKITLMKSEHAESAVKARPKPALLPVAIALCGLGLIATQGHSSENSAPIQSSILALSSGIAATPATSTGVEEQRVKESAKAKSKKDKKNKNVREEDKAAKKPWIPPSLLSGLKLRGIGPGLVSGRIVDLAVVPGKEHIRYLAVASGGVWKTDNSGTTWKPIFDGEGSYSIGCITLDPQDPKTVWVGTGENNSQRSVSWGDGVYKSTDGGTTWKNMGLKDSQHIGRIVVDPEDSNIVWVASQGPLWNAGGDRGLYKTMDGGESWETVLEIDEHTGISEVWLDPRDSDHAYAVAYQRARRVWTLIDGGPGSGIHETRDGGETWNKLSNGLPKEDLGRIGLALSPADPDVLYAIVEARSDKGKGVYRSVDGGSNWKKQSGYLSGSPQYYQELVPDPHDKDRVYSLDTFLMVSEDGGKNWDRLGQEAKHVDEHALWIDPERTDHLLSGNDGGLYESWDRGITWRFQPNLPLTQFYKVAVDNDVPFYNVYGGTQDNNTIGCPSRTRNHYGIANSDCYITVGGDGFQTRVDPTNPDIVYSQWQYGNLVRYDRKTGETLDIKPREKPGDEALRWNWDAPLIISPHSSTRIYYAAQSVFKSDDRGQSWTRLSEDLSRGLDHNELEIMGRRWSIDAVAKHTSTSPYGNLTVLVESPRVEGLLYAGTDDGLIQVLDPSDSTADSAGVPTWRKIEQFPGVPELTYVASIEPSLHDDSTAFAVFNDHKRGNFSPYVLVTKDRGRTWNSIVGNDSETHLGKLPDNDPAWVIEQDHVNPDLLFLGTESTLYTSLDGGEHWSKLSTGLPRIAVRDLDIQRRENDLLVGTFGRGFYILDDYSPLRKLDRDALKDESTTLFPPRDSWLFVESDQMGNSLGATHYLAPNPEFGATFTWLLGEDVESLKKTRAKREKELLKEKQPMEFPTLDELRTEEDEQEPQVVISVSDSDGNTIRRFSHPAKKGLHRMQWDLRHPSPQPIGGPSRRRFGRRGNSEPSGMFVVPGTYSFGAVLVTREGVTPLANGEQQTFTVKPLPGATLPTGDPADRQELHRKVMRLQRAALGAQRTVGEAQAKLDALRTALYRTPSATPEDLAKLADLQQALVSLRRELQGDEVLRQRQISAPPTLLGRVQILTRGLMNTTAQSTATHDQLLEVSSNELVGYLNRLRNLIESEIPTFEQRLEAAGAPWTPGRFPVYDPN